MAGKKYGKYILPVETKVSREGEPPVFIFSATPHGINASWAMITATQVYDEATIKRLYENPHKHDFHQFISYFGTNPLNLC
jgi:hypothetical protein